VSRGAFYVLSAIFLWSSLGVVVRLSGVPVHVLIFYSVLVALTLQGAIISRKAYRARIPRGRGLFKVLLLGPVALLNIFTFFYALKHTTITKAMMTHYIAPVVVAMLAPFLLKEALTKRVLASLAISLAGLWVLLGAGAGTVILPVMGPHADTFGVLSGLASGFAYAFLVIMVRAYARNYHPLVLAFFQNMMIFLLLLPFAPVFPAGALWSFLLVGVVHSTIAPVLYFMGLKEVRANRAAILGYLEPVSAIILGIIFLNEHPSALSLAGGALILFSGYLTLKE
jgi:drug/metabolite transporter (DMT)-like permease